jgi:pyrroline-5-carboxylate reductase
MATSLRDFPGQLLLVGCGNMAGAMLTQWLAAGLDPAQVSIVDPFADPRDGIAHYKSLEDWQAAGVTADWIMVGMKPQQLGSVAKTLAPVLTGETRLLSILAGVSLADLAARFPIAKSQVRIIPNMPASIGQGVTAVASLGSDGADDQTVDNMMGALGTMIRLPDDSNMDLVTAFTGSGPAFVFRLIEAYAAAGERLGLSSKDALKFATATFGGTTALLADSGQTPAALAAQVASKGGTTQAGLDVLDSAGDLVALMTNVLRAARDRGRELADLARDDGNA